MQLRELREYCGRRNWQCDQKYVDVGISGAKERRPELDQLLAEAHGRKFDAVVVWRFDRFARSVSHLLRALETFRALGIEFVSLSEQVDTTTPTGKMVFTVLGAVAGLWHASRYINCCISGSYIHRLPDPGVQSPRVPSRTPESHSARGLFGFCS
jgi:hypothetical protein